MSHLFLNSSSPPLGILSLACHEFSAIQAFAYLSWLIRESSLLELVRPQSLINHQVFGYNIVLLSFSIMAANRGVAIWTQSVKTADFNGSSLPQNVQQSVMQQPQYAGFSTAQYPPQAGHLQSPSAGHPMSVQV